MSLIKRADQYRFYPTAKQRQTLARTFGGCRWVYNHALARKTSAYREARQRLSYGDLSALLPLWKTRGADCLAGGGVLGAAATEFATSGSGLPQFL